MPANLPMPPNATCDIYHGSNLPPAPPDVAGVPCHLEEHFRNIKPVVFVYSHVMKVAVGTDVRDGYNGAGAADTVFVPDQNGSSFKVRAVARVARGTALDHLIVYLDRLSVNWPSQDT